MLVVERVKLVNFDQPDNAATPLTEEERRELKPSYIATRVELTVAE